MKDKLKAALANMGNGLKVFWGKVNTDVSELWDNSRIFLFTFLGLILLVKFRDLIVSIIVSSAKRIFEKAEQKSDDLQKKEDENNNEANDIVKQVEDVVKKDESSGDVPDDWYKKK